MTSPDTYADVCRFSTFPRNSPPGAARTDLARAKSSPDRAIASHLDDKAGVAAVLTAGEWSAELALHPLY
ncbi:hypothetical protein GQF03_05240 [Sneathiella chungangensis]|uniref:Uncharacterized protein n=1 Tax=Sneathiella chungangensis TaxID=1418234 RepID=A0A845MER7_9PROT|nr:hypothetical protein [Sneathiella chungangensis]MZR21727.1 hypothetical protein [Sneathiella chungangensis]